MTNTTLHLCLVLTTHATFLLPPSPHDNVDDMAKTLTHSPQHCNQGKRVCSLFSPAFPDFFSQPWTSIPGRLPTQRTASNKHVHDTFHVSSSSSAIVLSMSGYVVGFVRPRGWGDISNAAPQVPYVYNSTQRGLSCSCM